MLRTTGMYTLALEINLFPGDEGTWWNLLMTASAAASIPCILLYALPQRYFIQGIDFSRVK